MSSLNSSVIGILFLSLFLKVTGMRLTKVLAGVTHLCKYSKSPYKDCIHLLVINVFEFTLICTLMVSYPHLVLVDAEYIVGYIIHMHTQTRELSSRWYCFVFIHWES